MSSSTATQPNLEDTRNNLRPDLDALNRGGYQRRTSNGPGYPSRGRGRRPLPERPYPPRSNLNHSSQSVPVFRVGKQISSEIYSESHYRPAPRHGPFTADSYRPSHYAATSERGSTSRVTVQPGRNQSVCPNWPADTPAHPIHTRFPLTSPDRGQPRDGPSYSPPKSNPTRPPFRLPPRPMDAPRSPPEWPRLPVTPPWPPSVPAKRKHADMPTEQPWVVSDEARNLLLPVLAVNLPVVSMARLDHQPISEAKQARLVMVDMILERLELRYGQPVNILNTTWHSSQTVSVTFQPQFDEASRKNRIILLLPEECRQLWCSDSKVYDTRAAFLKQVQDQLSSRSFDMDSTFSTAFLIIKQKGGKMPLESARAHLRGMFPSSLNYSVRPLLPSAQEPRQVSQGTLGAPPVATDRAAAQKATRPAIQPEQPSSPPLDGVDLDSGSDTPLPVLPLFKPESSPQLSQRATFKAPRASTSRVTLDKPQARAPPAPLPLPIFPHSMYDPILADERLDEKVGTFLRLFLERFDQNRASLLDFYAWDGIFSYSVNPSPVPRSDVKDSEMPPFREGFVLGSRHLQQGRLVGPLPSTSENSILNQLRNFPPTNHRPLPDSDASPYTYECWRFPNAPTVGVKTQRALNNMTYVVVFGAVELGAVGTPTQLRSFTRSMILKDGDKIGGGGASISGGYTILCDQLMIRKIGEEPESLPAREDPAPSPVKQGEPSRRVEGPPARAMHPSSPAAMSRSRLNNGTLPPKPPTAASHTRPTLPARALPATATCSKTLVPATSPSATGQSVAGTSARPPSHAKQPPAPSAQAPPKALMGLSLDNATDLASPLSSVGNAVKSRKGGKMVYIARTCIRRRDDFVVVSKRGDVSGTPYRMAPVASVLLNASSTPVDCSCVAWDQLANTLILGLVAPVENIRKPPRQLQLVPLKQDLKSIWAGDVYGLPETPHAPEKPTSASGVSALCLLPSPEFGHLSFLSGGLDHQIHLWRLRSTRGPRGQDIELQPLHSKHTSSISSLEYNPSSKLLLAAGMDKRISQYDLRSGRTTHIGMRELDGQVINVQFNPKDESSFAASFGGRTASQVQIFDLRTFSATSTLPPTANVSLSFDSDKKLSSFNSGAFSPDGLRYALGNETSLHIWDARKTSRPFVTHKYENDASPAVQVLWQNERSLMLLHKKELEYWT